MPDCDVFVQLAGARYRLDDVLDNCYDRTALLYAATFTPDIPDGPQSALRIGLCDLQDALAAALKAVRGGASLMLRRLAVPARHWANWLRRLVAFHLLSLARDLIRAASALLPQALETNT